MRVLAKDDLDALWPAAPSDLVSGILTTQANAFGQCGIDNDLRLAHFMAQISHESGTGKEMVEGLNYAADALLKQWPTHFSSQQAQDYGRTPEHAANQRMIGNLAYGGRMGNAMYPSDDGYAFRGRGLLQITGRSSYGSIGNFCGLDLLNHPDLVVDPFHALAVAATEFRVSGCLPYCDADDLVAVSALVNVGHVTRNTAAIIGYEQRADWLTQWKQRLGV